MTRHDPEIEELREKVYCAVVLEQTPPCWKLDRKESAKLSLKYRRGKGEILIVSHAGRGWWDPTSDAKGDVFRLVHKGSSPGLASDMCASAYERSLGCRHVFRRPIGQGAETSRIEPSPPAGPNEGQFGRTLLPGAILDYSAGCRQRSLRRRSWPTFCGEGPVGSAWFAHVDLGGAVAHVDARGPTYKGSLTGGVKSLFRLPLEGPALPRLVLTEAAIDALSLAALESLRSDTLYAATGGGMGPGTIAALEALLVDIAMLPDALICSATDANGPGDRFADRHQSLARKFGIPFARLRPPLEGCDWNEVLHQSEAMSRKSKDS